MDILIVDDTVANLTLLIHLLKEKGHRIRPVTSGEMALKRVEKEPPDLILLDINMPGMNGFEVCRRLKEDPRFISIPVIFISALSETMDKAAAFTCGGVDYITKPFQFEEVMARVETHLKLRRYEVSMESLVKEQVKEAAGRQLAAAASLTRLAEKRDGWTAGHLERVPIFCRTLAERLRSDESPYRSEITREFVEDLVRACVLHDIGKIAVPEELLRKPGCLTPEEFETVKRHAIAGAQALEESIPPGGKNTLLRTAVAIARHHHERWDGCGYPDGLAGTFTPLAARILAVADVWDVLNSDRAYRKAFPFEECCRILDQSSGSHFDPAIIRAFRESREEFRSIRNRVTE